MSFMPREKVTDVCSVCGEKKPLFDVKNKLCGSCSGKRGGGRPKAIKVKEKPADPLLPANPKTAVRPGKTEESVQNSSPAPTNSTEQTSEKYLCEACNAPVRYGQRKCKCGTWLDWRGTAVEQDPEIVICPECGAVCGFAEDGPAKCPHCNKGG
jgi:hypothetical protein